MASKKYKLVLEFSDPWALLDFADLTFPPDTEVYKTDGLDFPHSGDSRTYIIRRAGDRPEVCALRHQLGDQPRPKVASGG